MKNDDCFGSEDRLRTTVHEPGGFVPLLRLEQRSEPDLLELIQARRLLASQGQELPEAYRPPVRDLRLACFHIDHLGTPLRLTDEQGRIRWRAEADDWAAVRDEQGDTDQPIRFQGQYHDEESGLYYNRYRYYAPELGRYVSQDPIGLLGGMNSYAYGALNSVLNFDPTGLETAIIFNGPVSDNPFGHAALALEGVGVISYGTGDTLGTSLSEYMKKMQPRRNSHIWVLDTTSEQENCMLSKAKEISKRKGMGVLMDNCASRTHEMLDACGLKTPLLYKNLPATTGYTGDYLSNFLNENHKRIDLPKGSFEGLPKSLEIFK